MTLVKHFAEATEFRFGNRYRRPGTRFAVACDLLSNVEDHYRLA